MGKVIALAGKITPAAKEMIQRQIGGEFEIVSIVSGDEVDKIRHADYIVARGFAMDEHMISLLGDEVKLIHRWGVGYDSIDIAAAGKRGIRVAVCAGMNAQPVAEMTVMLILAVYRRIFPISNGIRNGVWKSSDDVNKSYMVKGKTVGLIGLGNIGSIVAKILQGFGAKVQYYDKYRSDREEELGLTYVSREELIATSDIVSLHIPLTEETRGSINRDTFQKMKKSAVLINTSRGAVVNQKDLYEALKNGEILGAGMDTFMNEPLEPDNPLLQLDCFVATPHAGASTCDNDANMVGCILENIRRIDRGEPALPHCIVNEELMRR